MDVFWFILDSLSFSATPFADDELGTMPELSSLVEERGLNFTEAYVPGPKSPSSHGSFLTGQLPSRTGMHEARPVFNTDLPTTADSLSETHRTLLISSNPFLFNGLDERFHEQVFLNNRERILFEGGTDPEAFKWKQGHDSRIDRYTDFVFGSGTPVRSLLNGIYYKIQEKSGNNSLIPSSVELDPISYQSVETINEKVGAFANQNEDVFVVANYMDVHPPLNASDVALEKFISSTDRDATPIGESGQQLQDTVEERGLKPVSDLYHAAIWDLDRKFTPFVRQLVEDGAFVVVTADHGNWFKPEAGLTDEKLHVPLILFGPDIHQGEVSSSVNVIQLPATTMKTVGRGEESPFQGHPLTEVSNNEVSITEYIRAEGGGPVDPYGNNPSTIHDVVGIKGMTRMDYRDGEYELRSTNSEEEESVREAVDAVLSQSIVQESGALEYDVSTEKRLRELGYL